MKVLPQIYPFIIFTIIMAIGPICLIYTGNSNYLIPEFWGMFAFISILTLIVLLAILVGQAIDPEMYAQYFMGATAFKLFACLIFILVFVLKHKVNKPVFMADFFYLYFLNTAFEVYVLLRNLRNQNLK